MIRAMGCPAATMARYEASRHPSKPFPFPACKPDGTFVFVSYAHADRAVVYPELERIAAHRVRIWYDEGIEPTSEWPQEIGRAIGRASLFIVMITPASAESRNVHNEVNAALKWGKPVLPIHLAPTDLPDGMELQLGSIQAIRRWQMDDGGYEQLLSWALSAYVKHSTANTPGMEAVPAASNQVQSPQQRAVADQIRRPVNSPTVDQLDEDARKLRDSVLQQWTDEVELRISIYPLPVPFSATAEVTGPVTFPVPGGKPEDRVVTVAVMDSWAAILREPDPQPPRIDGTFDSIAEIFGAGGLPSRLVVLGEPGSGKSIMAQSLTVRLLGGGPAVTPGDATLPASSKAIPVLLPLATWDPTVALRDWAAAQIARTYPWLGTKIQVRGGVRRTLAGWLLDQGKVLMVLDGLDEIAAENRLAAFRKLSEAARKNQAMVVTCRTREYAQIVHDAKHPMPRTPVIRLHPLPPADVRAYLTAAGQRSGGRAGQLVDQLNAEPRGPLAEALRSPLALWLVTTVYQDPDKDPAELAQYPSRGEILKHLLDGLVTAAYSAPAGDYPAIEDPAAVEVARRRLIKIATYLGPDLQSQNIDWWRLPEQVPRLFTGGLIGTLVGSVLGAAVGLAAATRFSDHAGVSLGIIFGIITGLLSGITSVRPQDHPRTVDLHFRWDYWRFVGCLTVGVAVGLTSGYADAHHGGLVAGLITAAVVGPVCAAPCIRAFRWAPGVTAGITAATAFGLSSGLSTGNGRPALSGLLAGLVFAISAWVFVGIFQPAQDKFVVTPQLLLDRDRVGSLTVAATAGIAFGVVYGVALGPFFGLVALVALTVSVAVTVSVWAAFNLSRVWLTLTGMVPMRAMAFLYEAYCRGVLRQVGGSYQFRHTELKEALLPAPKTPAALPRPGEPQGATGKQSTP